MFTCRSSMVIKATDSTGWESLDRKASAGAHPHGWGGVGAHHHSVSGLGITKVAASVVERDFASNEPGNEVSDTQSTSEAKNMPGNA
jgi:hypothetical protein